MTDLIVSIIILAAWCGGGVALMARQRWLAHRRAQRAQLRRIMAYRAASSERARIYKFPGHSVKVVDAA